MIYQNIKKILLDSKCSYCQAISRTHLKEHCPKCGGTGFKWLYKSDEITKNSVLTAILDELKNVIQED